MERTILSQEELNKRCAEVFELQEDDYIFGLYIDDTHTVKVLMSEVDHSGQTFFFEYIPDMTDRPEALDYLMGDRNDFND